MSNDENRPAVSLTIIPTDTYDSTNKMLDDAREAGAIWQRSAATWKRLARRLFEQRNALVEEIAAVLREERDRGEVVSPKKVNGR